MKKFLVIAALLCASFLSAEAQNSINVEAPNMVASDEQFNVTFVIEGENAPSDFSWNSGDDFQLVWGPQKGSSTSISVINGKRTKSSQTTYTYVLLPKKTGTFNLPAAVATVKGGTITSGAFSIQVLSGGSSSQGGSPAQSGTDQKIASTGDIEGGDLFLKLSVSSTNVVVGEPLNATLKLYQRVNISAFEDVKFPTFNGFWSQEVQAPSNIDFHRENVGDQIYNAAVLRSWSLIPQQSGTLTIDPAELVCLVNVRVASSSGSIFDSFFQDDYRTLRKRISSSAVKIKVSALPAGAPASFGGGVGKFTMNSSLSKTSLKAHDAASLVVTVSGKGNVSLLEAPKISFPPDFDVYDVKASESADKSTKTFEYPFIPRSHGEFTIDPVEYTYFDTGTRKYVTLKGQPMDLTVEKGAASDSHQDAGQIVPGVVRKDVKDLSNDIRYIHSGALDFKKLTRRSSFLGSGLSVALAVLYFLAGAAVWLALRKVRARRSDVRASRNRTATKMARKRLSKAGEYLQQDLGTAFYEELHRTLLGFASDKLGLDPADLTKDSVRERFCSAGVPDDVAGRFVELLDACEFARYAPDSGHEAMNAHFEGAVEVISQIDSDMKKKIPASSVLSALIILLTLPAFQLQASETAPLDSLWSSACNAYASGLWQDALGNWQQIEQSGVKSAELYYNIGNACFKAGEFPLAILYYERALKTDPSHKDAKYNLAFAKEMSQDRIEEVPEFFLRHWLRTLCWKLDADGWGILFHILIAAAVLMLLLFLLGREMRTRKLGFYLAIVLLLLSLFALAMGKWQIRERESADYAIVMRPVASVKSSPGDGGAKDLFILHEGTKVHILDAVGEWNNVELADGRQGWMKAVDMETI